MAPKKNGVLPPTKENLSNGNVLQVEDGLEGITKDMNGAEIGARIATRGHMTAYAMKAHSGFDGDAISITAVANELRANGDAVVNGDLSRIERMLIGQAITLDAIFGNLAERSTRQEFMKNKEIYLRLALKAQSQCRATAEALALIKNPVPYIRQANIAQGHQQVNNYGTQPGGTPAQLENNPSHLLPGASHAGAEFQSLPSKLLG